MRANARRGSTAPRSPNRPGSRTQKRPGNTRRVLPGHLLFPDMGERQSGGRLPFSGGSVLVVKDAVSGWFSWSVGDASAPVPVTRLAHGVANIGTLDRRRMRRCVRGSRTAAASSNPSVGQRFGELHYQAAQMRWSLSNIAVISGFSSCHGSDAGIGSYPRDHAVSVQRFVNQM